MHVREIANEISGFTGGYSGVASFHGKAIFMQEGEGNMKKIENTIDIVGI